MNASPVRLSLARLPTPIEALDRLSEAWGISLRVKRDDLTGVALSGNKIRKLEYLLADAEAQGCDTIITCGAVTSNHARATAIAARKRGLNCVLILAGDPPEHAHGNLQLDLLVGAEVRYITRHDYSTRIAHILHETTEELRATGRSPYPIPSGGSNAVGLLGYTECVRELKDQCDADDWHPDTVVCAVGSGGTYAGLVLGNTLHGLNSHIRGVIVCDSVAHFSAKARDDIREACTRFRMDAHPPDDSHSLVDGYVAGGYAKTNDEQLGFLREVARSEALILDPVYTNKAFFGLYSEVKAGRIAKGSRVLFIHTGGIFGLSAYARPMTELWGSVERW